MSELGEPTAELSPTKRALLALRRLRDEVERARAPVAIVGMACRLPGGADDPEQLWRLLRSGEDAVTGPPAGRFVDEPSRCGGVRWGGFLERVDLFDPAFFGIDPSDADRMDPQQRLLLEVAWEALENAGIPPDRLRGTRAGVFLTAPAHDYWIVQRHADATAAVDLPLLLGSAPGIGAGRLAYLLDLRGPAVAVDAACSSALAALHLACRSLRTGESSLAIVGAANVLLAPEVAAAFARGGHLSPDGRCRAFDAAAGGFVRSEGCGVLVLERLSDALADGDPIRAVVRGSAVNHNGRGAGLTVPNAAAQEEVMREALRDARVDPARITYVEGHGSGTLLGDAIELEALKAVFGEPRADGSRCAVGAVKASLGHLEAASGIAAVTKVVLALEHEEIPPQVHFQRLNPNVSLTATPLEIPRRSWPWPRGSESRLAVVHGSSMSGTNAHVVLEEGPPTTRRTTADAFPADAEHLLLVSARDAGALRRLARRYAHQLAEHPELLADIAYSAAVRRAHHPLRIAAVGRDAAGIAAQLEAFADDDAEGLPIAGLAEPRRRCCAFVFAGRGAYWPGMGAEPLSTEPCCRETLDRCDEALEGRLAPALRDDLGDRAARACPPDLECASVVAVELALAALWRRWGIEPDAVVGEGIGELAAACLAGALSIDEAMHAAVEVGRSAHHDGRPARDAAKRAGGPWPRPPLLPLYAVDASTRSETIERVVRDGFDVLLDVGPQPTLTSVAAALREGGVVAVHSLQKDAPGREALLRALAALHVAGMPIDWRRVHADTRRFIRPPAYPWSHQRCWYTRRTAVATSSSAGPVEIGR